MVEKLLKEIKGLKKDVVKMSRLAEDMLKKSVESLLEQDEKKADWVISHKEKIKHMDADIEHKTLHLIALYQPMAKDMRTIACILKVITYLTRIGRYGKNIAMIEKEVTPISENDCLTNIPEMSKLVCSMIEDALKAFEKEDLDLIKDFSERDDVIDQMRYDIFRKSVTLMKEDKSCINECANYAMVARYLERCGDHSCKIAEKTIYMVTGDHIAIK